MHLVHALQLRTVHLSGGCLPFTTVRSRKHHVCLEPATAMVRCDPSHDNSWCVVLCIGAVLCRRLSTPRWRRSRPSAPFSVWTGSPRVFKRGVTTSPPTVVLGGDLANVMRAVCVISNSTAIAKVSSVWHRFAKEGLDTPPLQWRTVLLGGFVACSRCVRPCRPVSVAQVGAVECRRCFWDVRKPCRPFDMESSSESESTASQRGIFLW